jgi:uncharacterized protein (DUF1330 family)
MRHVFATVLLAGLVGGCATTTDPDRTSSTPRAYVIAEIQVTDPTGYQEYLAAISPIVERFGGTYLVRGGKTMPVEGLEPNGRIVVIAFPSFSAARAFEDAPESVAAGKIRHRTAKSRIFVVEGASP